MKKLITLFMSCMMVVQFANAETPVQLEVGAIAPNQKQVMKDVSGTEVTLDLAKDKNGLLVMFSCNTCPFVIAWEDRYPAIAEYCDANGIGLVVVNSNEARRTGSDSFDAMKEKAAEQDYDFYYTYDENHVLADAFGATKTPDVFLFNGSLELAYKGAIDDNHKDADAVESDYLHNALVNMLAGEVIDPNATRSVGCSIKRSAPTGN